MPRAGRMQDDPSSIHSGYLMTADSNNTDRATSSTEPEAFEASSLSASLTVATLQSSIVWYRDVLGFTVDRMFDRAGTPFAASLRAGAVRILLTQDDGGKGTERAKGEGISLRFTTTQNVDALAARVRERGGTLDTEPFDGMGQRAFRLRDPDGFKFVISSER
jgi:uncharacterized glyoxalase superfamily protein PhnB